MKTQMGVYVDQSTAELLRTRATESGAAIGDLADLCIRYTLGKITLEQLRTWALKQPVAKGRLAGQHTKDERAVLLAFDALAKREPGTWRYAYEALAAEAGLKLSPTFWALKSLQRRGEVHGMELDEVDRWGRPVKSFWSMVAAMPEAARPQPR